MSLDTRGERDAGSVPHPCHALDWWPAQAYARSPQHKAAVQATYAGVVDEFDPRDRAVQSGAPTVLPDRPLPLSMSLLQPLSEAAATRIFSVLNLSPVLWWALMILAPRAAITRALTRTRVLFVGLGAFYAVSLLRAIVVEAGVPNFGSLDDGPRRLFNSRSGLLAGWVHFLAFDLFVGIWIYRTGLAEQRPTRVPLALTFMAGPVGLLWFLVQRGLGRALPYPFEAQAK